MALIKSISGIRGTIGGQPGDALTPIDVVLFTAAFGSWIRDAGGSPKIVIGRDARPSGDMVSKLVTATLQGLGLDVVDLGLSTTPTVEMAVTAEGAGGGIILTASHNPVQWNALKLLNAKGEFISGQDGEEVLRIAEAKSFSFAEVKKLGNYTLKEEEYLDYHIQKILDLPLVDVDAIRAQNFSIVVDAVNSSGGIAIPRLLKALGVTQVKEMYCEPNGQFPHNPEPLPEHLTDICREIKNGKYHLGIVVDPDVDRLALISDTGEPFGEEYTLVAVADYVLQANGGGNTVSNLSSSRALRDVTEKQGGSYAAAAVGEVNVVEKMKETGALIGGEGNGGIIYPELHYGRDALVGVALFLSHLAKWGKSVAMLRSKYPNYHISKNKIELTPDIDVDRVLQEIQQRYAKHDINTIDGVKIDFEQEWVHLRKSNTEPIIRIYSESSSPSTAEHLSKKIISDIKEIISTKADQ
ncbi:phosphoglucosamine mutase [Cesiribacter andamanensis]|uniref:Phosphomannomutase/phosphoglucomutase n=1 Tax=Cesiribacter andamanensis AMV16 TaxID=1279009 RepID=M7P0V7_9BACT|nr:phosphoglucosamine mutase [Cesiribacter andamanensis]EMR04219.1 Phosphomannomutase/phosphoglucomutase [Cesiribacter andamanensis AMV16]